MQYRDICLPDSPPEQLQEMLCSHCFCLGLMQLRAPSHLSKHVAIVSFYTTLLLTIFKYAIQKIVLIASEKANQGEACLGEKDILLMKLKFTFN